MSRFRTDHRRPRRTAPARALPQPELLNIEKLAAGGVGFSRRTSGEPVFVRGALPGDTVSVRQMITRKGYSEATAWEVASPSADRRAVPCRYAARCGGCDLMALSPAAQRRVKHDMVVEILRRTAHLDVAATSATPLTWNDEPADAAARADRPIGYRSRIRLHIDGDGKLGFLGEQSHTVVPIDRCLVADDRVNQVLTQLVALSELRPELLKPFTQVEIRALGEVPDLLWLPKRQDDKPRHATTALASVLETIERHLRAEAPNLALHLVLSTDAPQRWREFVQGVELEDTQSPNPPRNGDRESSAPARLLFAPGTFTQVNWTVNLRLIADLLAMARRLEARRFLDLYCGAGNFSLPLLAMGLQGIGVESNPTSIAAATTAATQQQLGGTFHAEDVAHAVGRLVRNGERFDLIVLDPPRAGFRDVVPKLVELAPKYVFVCACDPVTFARDLHDLVAAGFKLEHIQAYDMFPQTHHVECTAWLSYAATHSPE